MWTETVRNMTIKAVCMTIWIKCVLDSWIFDTTWVRPRTEEICTWSDISEVVWYLSSHGQIPNPTASTDLRPFVLPMRLQKCHCLDTVSKDLQVGRECPCYRCPDQEIVRLLIMRTALYRAWPCILRAHHLFWVVGIDATIIIQLAAQTIFTTICSIIILTNYNTNISSRFPTSSICTINILTIIIFISNKVDLCKQVILVPNCLHVMTAIIHLRVASIQLVWSAMKVLGRAILKVMFLEL